MTAFSFICSDIQVLISFTYIFIIYEYLYDRFDIRKSTIREFDFIYGPRSMILSSGATWKHCPPPLQLARGWGMFNLLTPLIKRIGISDSKRLLLMHSI